MSHWDVKETILASPDKQRRYFDFLSRLTHSIRIDHASVIVDRTGQITLYFKKIEMKCWLSYKKNDKTSLSTFEGNT